MKLHEASPTDTFDHMIGSGALSWSWWLGCEGTSKIDVDVPEDWEFTLTCDSGVEQPPFKKAVLNHDVVIKAAYEVARMYFSNNPEEKPACSNACVRECIKLVTDPDDCDFDADSADELLQLIVLGEVVFG